MKIRNSILIGIFSFLIIVFLIAASMYPKSQIFGEVMYQLDTDEKKIALTFDDGPGPETAQILDILKEKNVTATFFVVGNQVKLYPELIQRMHDEGHTIGLHSMSHPILWKNSEQEINEELTLFTELYTNERIHVKYFRPPYGFRTPWTISYAHQNNLTTVTWDIFTRDSLQTKEETTHKIISKLHPGAIICIHDGPVNRQETAAALSLIIDEARKQGYEFVSLSYTDSKEKA